MGCSSCGKNAAARVGLTLNTAIVFGDPTPEVYRVRVVGNVPGLQTGAIKYVRGTGVQALVESGDLAMLAGSPRTLASQAQGSALYYVGNIGYTSLETARVRSGQSGEEIVVRTLTS